MADTFRCSLCLDQFTDPRILSCRHTFCQDCLKEYVRESPLFNCPLCRTKHTLPSTGVDGLRKNFYLHEPTKYKMCVEHPTEDLRFFCCHCRTQICRDCKIVSHEGHATEMADNVVAKTRVTLKESLTDANISIKETGTALIATIEQELTEHETSITVLTAHARIMKHEIDKLLTETVAMIQPLHDRGKMIIQDIHAQMEEKNKHILQYEKMLSKAIKTNEHKPVFELFEKLIDNEVIKELTSLPLAPKPKNIIEAVDEQMLKSSFVRLTDALMHNIKEFKTIDFKKRRPQEKMTNVQT